MSVTGKPLPSPKTYLETLDRELRATVTDAKADVAAIVERETPKKSGRTAGALRPRIGRTSTGYQLLVGAPRGASHGSVTVSEVVAFLTKGTGKFRAGPGPHRAIRARQPWRRLNLGHGVERFSVKGQHPNPFMARIRTQGTARVQQAAETGADRAARALEALVTRG